MVGFLLFEQWHGKTKIHSSKIRGNAVIANWNPATPWGPAEAYKIGRDYKALIYQKVYWWQHARLYNGLKILDLCDADWLHWDYPVKHMIEAVDGVTCSSQALAEAVAAMTDKPVAVIDDRFDFSSYPAHPKVHHDRPTETIGWHGYSENLPMLDGAVAVLPKHGIKRLIVIADRRVPYQLPVGMNGKIELVNLPWTEETVLADLMQADILINPQSHFGRWKYKSRNKTVMGWALGLPVAHTEEELIALIDPVKRKAEAERRFKEAREKFHVKDSVAELIEFMNICAEQAGKTI